MDMSVILVIWPGPFIYKTLFSLMFPKLHMKFGFNCPMVSEKIFENGGEKTPDNRSTHQENMSVQ